MAMSDELHAAFAAMTDQQQRTTLMALDELSRPLTVREIEAALQAHGVTRSRAVIIASAVKRLHIIALVGGEQHG